jgi:BirA family biotin operon repressor/biotin-[acetyl-CoA-carboxylase] ligase
MATSGAPDGVVIVANEQTGGRGRFGRAWISPPGEGLYFSLILRPRVAPAGLSVLTLAAAVAVAETLSIDFAVPADIKWPNDVLSRDRKICGILVESAIEADTVQFVIVGIGVNISQEIFPPGIVATSVLLESGRRISPDEFLHPLLTKLDIWLDSAKSKPAQVIQRWQDLSITAVGADVRVVCPDQEFEGTTQGLTSSGALRIKKQDGSIAEVVSAEVTQVRRTNPPG